MVLILTTGELQKDIFCFKQVKKFVFTPYADAGNDGAAFRTVFPLDQSE